MFQIKQWSFKFVVFIAVIANNKLNGAYRHLLMTEYIKISEKSREITLPSLQVSTNHFGSFKISIIFDQWLVYSLNIDVPLYMVLTHVEKI